jgi:hypothetical protein
MWSFGMNTPYPMTGGNVSLVKTGLASPWSSPTWLQNHGYGSFANALLAFDKSVSPPPTKSTCSCQSNSSKGVTRMNPVFRLVTTGPLSTSNPFGRRISPVLKLTPSQTAILIAWEQKAPGIVAQALKLVPPPTVGHGSSGGGGWFNDFLGTITSLGKSYLDYRSSEAQLSAAQAQQQLQQQLAAYGISLSSGSGLGGISTTTLLIGGAVVLGAVVLMGKKKRK